MQESRGHPERGASVTPRGFKRPNHPLLIIILTGFVVLAIGYSLATPIFEAGDEIWHYPFVQHVATGHSLPVQDPAVETLWEQEGGQPPLYYALGAALTFWIDTHDLPDRLWKNPHVQFAPLAFRSKNMIVHTSAEDWPWRNTTLAVHLLRLFSILLSAGTVVLTYLFALELRPGQRLAAAAAALVAFNPMFLFISASVNNDNLAVMLATLSLWLLARLVTRGPTLPRFVVLGVVLGLAVLSKVSNLGLLVLSACVFLYLLWREAVSAQGASPASRPGMTGWLDAPRAAGILRGSLVCAAVVVAIAGWWYARNWLLYGDPLAFNVWIEIAGGRPTPLTLGGLLDEFQGFRISFWGNLGGVNIIAPEWVYNVIDGLTALAGIGLLVGLVRRTLPRLAALPALWTALIIASLIRWTMLTLASQGRLIFPAIAALAVLLAFGLDQLRLPGARSGILRFPAAQSAFVVFLFLFALSAPFALIAPNYALPIRLPANASVANATHIVFDGQAELVGYALPQKSVDPGGELPLVVYWRALQPIGEDLSVYIRLFDMDENIVGRWDAFPGGGLYPTRLWQPNELIVDTYRVPVALNARSPGVGRVEVGLYRRAPLENLDARDPQGRTVTPTLARFKVRGLLNVEIPNPVRFEFGDQIGLVGYAVEEGASTLRTRLYWRARAEMQDDYSVFVHLVDARGKSKIVAQQDGQPLQGAYPTSFWDVGETVVDEYVVEVPGDASPGDYQVVVGIYRASDGTRLGVKGGGDSLVLATVAIRR